MSHDPDILLNVELGPDSPDPQDGYALVFRTQYNQWFACPAAGTRVVGPITSDYTASSGDIVLCDTTNGGFTVTIHAVESIVDVKKIDLSGNGVTVQMDSGTIDHQANVLIASPCTSYHFATDGTNGWVI